jgi:hypothetical protein
VNQITERIDDYWMSRTPRQVLIWCWVYYPVGVLTLMAAMVAVVELGA